MPQEWDWKVEGFSQKAVYTYDAAKLYLSGKINRHTLAYALREMPPAVAGKGGAHIINRNAARDHFEGPDPAEARARLDYALRHPGPAEIAERRADLMGDATVDRDKIDSIIRREVEQARNKPISWEVVGNRQILPFVGSKENGTMDSEVKAAKQHVREREQERWNRVEQVGRQAIDSDRARVTEKQAATTKADEDTERPRPRMMP